MSRLILAILVLGAVLPASATHFRYGTLSWAPTAKPGEVKIEITEAFRRSFQNNWGYRNGPNLGDRITFGTISFGDGSSTGFEKEVIAVDLVNDIIIVAALDPGTGNRGILHTYNGAGPYNVSYGSCCRISNLENGADENYRLRTSIRPLAGNASPISTQTPVVKVPRSNNSSFTVPAVDPNGDGLRWRFATESEAGFSQNLPPGITINPNSGRVTWNNKDLAQGPWTLQVVVEDLDANGAVKTKTPVDFLMTIEDVSGNAPTIAINPPAPISVLPGTAISFSVHASDIDTNSSLNLTTSGLPPGATTTPELPVSGVSGSPGPTVTFHWTPTPAQAGTYVAFFNVTDETGQQAQASIQITVTELPKPTVVTNAATLVGQTSATLNGTVNPNGVPTTYRFEYGLTKDYGDSTAPISAGSGNSNSPASSAISGLNLSTIYHYRIIATSAGGTSVGDDVTFTTEGIPNIPPTITLTSPQNNATVLEIDPVGISADADDQDGTILKVEFFVDGTKAGESITEPYEITVPPLPVGAHIVTARATDNSGVAVTSPAVTVNVVEAVPIARDDHAFVATYSRINPRSNDEGPAGYPLTIVAVGGSPTHGTVSIVEQGGRLLYTSNSPLAPDETDSFTYTVQNSIGRASTATVTIHPSPPAGSQFVGYLSDHEGNKQAIITYYFGYAGRFTGKITYDGLRTAFRGNLNGDSPLEMGIRRGTKTIPFELSAGPIVNGSVTLDGRVPDPFGEEHWEGLAERSPYSRDNLASAAGSYTSVCSPDPTVAGDPSFPQGGTGFIIRVTRFGVVRIAGRMPDRRGISEGSYLLTGNRAPFFAAVGLGNRRGFACTELTFTDGPGPEVSGNVVWMVPARAQSQFYPLGFEVNMPLIGCRYNAPRTPSGMLASPAITLNFSGAGLTSPVSVPLVLGAKTMLSGPAPLGRTQINHDIGRIIGILENPETGERLKFNAILLQHPSLNRGAGFVLGDTAIGPITVVPAP